MNFVQIYLGFLYCVIYKIDNKSISWEKLNLWDKQFSGWYMDNSGISFSWINLLCTEYFNSVLSHCLIYQTLPLAEIAECFAVYLFRIHYRYDTPTISVEKCIKYLRRFWLNHWGEKILCLFWNFLIILGFWL